MSRFFGSARLATILAVAAALIVTSVAAGAAGAALILGHANTSGSAATSVTSSNGTRTFLVQNSSSTGFAIDARSQGGIGGQFLSATSTGMAGFTSASDKFAVVGTQNAASFGGGAAIRGDGRQNDGVSGTTNTDAADAVRGVNMATSADFGTGLYANGVYGETRAADGNGVFGFATASTGQGYGVWGISESADGVGVTGSSGTGGGLAGLFQGDVSVDGAITVTSCTGCGTTAVVTKTVEPIAQGDAVAIAGVTTDAAGTPTLLVRRATATDRIVGVANSSITYVTDKHGARRLVAAGAGAAKGAFLSVVTRGLLAMAPTAGTKSLATGAALSVQSGGSLSAASASSPAVAFLAGTLKDGRVVLFVNP